MQDLLVLCLPLPSPSHGGALEPAAVTAAVVACPGRVPCHLEGVGTVTAPAPLAPLVGVCGSPGRAGAAGSESALWLAGGSVVAPLIFKH